MKIRIGTRSSKLALTQANWVQSQIESQKIECEIIPIETKGDLILNKALNKIGDKGLFTAELEEVLLNESIEIAVHCLKDLPTQDNSKLPIVCIPKREMANDCVIFSHKFNKCKDILDLPLNSIIGTSSLRRISQIKSMRPDFQIVHLRGNIETRIRKIKDGFEGIDAGILAVAGIYRLNQLELIDQILNVRDFIPAPGQGALAIQINSNSVNSRELSEILELLHDKESSILVGAEREALRVINGGCQTPFGAYAERDNINISLFAFIGNEDGTKICRKTKTGLFSEYSKLGNDLGLELNAEINTNSI